MMWLGIIIVVCLLVIGAVIMGAREDRTKK